jgi:glycosyltransferase involved in cell wall biosynthesis
MTVEKLAIFNPGPLWKHNGEYHYTSTYYRFVEELSQYFREISVLAPVHEERPPSGVTALDSRRVGVLELPSYSNIETSFAALGRYIRQYGRWRIDLKGFDAIILMDYLIPFYWFFRVLAKKHHVPVIQYMRANDAEVIRSSEYGRLKKTIAVALSGAGFQLLQLLSRRTPTLVAGKELYEIFSRRTSSVRSISPSGVSTRDLSPAPSRRFDGETLKLLYVGRLQRAKGVEELIEALARASADGKQFELSIVGADAHGGRYLQRLNEQVARSGLRDVVRFHGHVPFGDELMDLYRGSDVFVLPSYSEGRPKVLYEAMAAGMAIIATKTGGIPEVIEDGANGLLVEPGDVGDLAAALKKVHSDRGLPKCISAIAAQRASEFTVERSAEHAAEMINEVMTLRR